MNALVNGVPTELPDGATVADVLTRLGHDVGTRGIAVAVNGEVVPRTTWDILTIGESDRLEILTAVQGG